MTRSIIFIAKLFTVDGVYEEWYRDVEIIIMMIIFLDL